MTRAHGGSDRGGSDRGGSDRGGSDRGGSERAACVALTDFEASVLAVVRSLGSGEIVTYGEVAAEVGKPGAARAVGSVLRRHGGDVPWWRVVAANGRLVPGGEQRHTERLRNEGVAIRNGRVVMGVQRS